MVATERRDMTPAELASVRAIPTGILSPSVMTTFKRADGELIDDEFGWTTDLEATAESIEEPVALVEETWQRATFRTFWLLPEPCGSCEFPMPDPEGDQGHLCDEDATAWVRDPDTGKWQLRCAWHDGEVIACQG